MRIDLTIETGSTSAPPWAALSLALNDIAQRYAPSFSVWLEMANRPGGGIGVALAVCCDASDVETVMALVFKQVREVIDDSDTSWSTVALASGEMLGRVDRPDTSSTPPISPAADLSQDWMQAFTRHSEAAVAAARAAEVDRGVGTVDQVRGLFERVTGQRHAGVIRRQTRNGAPGFSIALKNGHLFAVPAAGHRGCTVFELFGNNSVGRIWSTAPSHGIFSLYLHLGHYLSGLLASADAPLDAVFSHEQIAKTDTGVSRRHFTTASLGPVVFHSRASGAGRRQMVVEVPQRQLVRLYEVEAGVLPQSHADLAALPF